MLEAIATICSSAAVITSFLSILWIWRCTSGINSINGIIAVVIFAFALWQWVHHGVDPDTWPHIGSGIFVTFNAAVNVFYTCFLQLKVNTDRRKKDNRRQSETPTKEERRNKDRRKSSMMKHTKLKVGKN